MKKKILTAALLSLLSLEALASGLKVETSGMTESYGNGVMGEPIARCNMTYHEKRKYYMDMKKYAQATNDPWAYYFLALVKIHGHDYRYTTLSCAKRYMGKALKYAEKKDKYFFSGQNYQLQQAQDLETAQRIIKWKEPAGDHCPKPKIVPDPISEEKEPNVSTPPSKRDLARQGYKW